MGGAIKEIVYRATSRNLCIHIPIKDTPTLALSPRPHFDVGEGHHVVEGVPSRSYLQHYHAFIIHIHERIMDNRGGCYQTLINNKWRNISANLVM